MLFRLPRFQGNLTFHLHNIGTLNICIIKFDAKNVIDKMAAMSAYTKSFFMGFYSYIIFFIDHYHAGGIK